MEQYIVSARKYRPSTFNTVVGQKALTSTLKNAIATERLAHAYLFCGSRGVGKTSCARIFAKTINCKNRTADGEPCNECDSCRAFNAGQSMNIIELDAASHNGIEDMRALIEQVMMPPTQGRYRVFIIDEVHMLSQAAFNAFLKTLEEPPSYVIFILATTEKHKIIPTILSRCQIYDFSRITIQDMVDHLTYVAGCENISAEPAALNVIARQADGAMRDALSIFDQVAASSMGNITYKSTIENLNVLDSKYYSRLLDNFLSGNVPGALLVYKEVREKGFDSQFFINGVAQYLRNLMVARDPSTLSLLEASDEEKVEMAENARRCTPDFFYRAMSLCNDADLNFRMASNKQFLIELTLIKLCQLLSPSPDSGDGEGQLKPIAQPSSPGVQVTPTPVATPPRQSAPQNVAPPQPEPAVSGASHQQTSATTQTTAPQASTPQPTAQSNDSQTGNVVRRPGVTLRGGLMHKDTPKSAPVENRPKRAAEYTQDAVQVAWDAYIASHPTAQIIINTMRASRPERIEADRYSITVENDIQVANMQAAMPEILDYMRTRLLNDNFDVEVRVNVGRSSPMTWNEREVLAHMIETNPKIRSFIEDLGLSLS